MPKHRQIHGLELVAKVYTGLSSISYNWLEVTPGGHLNKKDGLTRYGDSHVKDKTS